MDDWRSKAEQGILKRRTELWLGVRAKGRDEPSANREFSDSNYYGKKQWEGQCAALRNKMFALTCNLNRFCSSAPLFLHSTQSIDPPKICLLVLPCSFPTLPRKHWHRELLFLPLHEPSNPPPLWDPRCQTIGGSQALSSTAFLAVCFLTLLLTGFKYAHLEILLG